MNETKPQNLNLKPNCQNDVRFGCLSRKRSSNWRPPVVVKRNMSSKSSVSTRSNQNGSHIKTDTDLSHINSRPRQTDSHELDRLDEGSTIIIDAESNYKEKHENRLYWPPSRHKNDGEMTFRNSSTCAHNPRISDSNHQQQEINLPSSPYNTTRKSDLHSAVKESDIIRSTRCGNDILKLRRYSCCKEHTVKNNNEGDFLFRKITNLFFRRNQIQNLLQQQQYNFFKWLNVICNSKTLFNFGGGMTMMRCKKKTMSYFGSCASTLICLLIFSVLISGPGEAYPVEGGMYNLLKYALCYDC